ncbi:helix-turn-helix transcriptional regulator [Streptococcus ruminantium]|uniref:helix-turn-helix transcriptional regulator n=1 Tax=Streptococcus ruminantium TaxID=1917441 RepID=UPI0012DDA2D5|nr:MerR family transcriptional regulator [Streptococcus ruminantium]
MNDLKQIELLLQSVLELLKHLTEQHNNSGIYTQKEILEILNISPNTLKSWEHRGLPRLEPPIEGTRTVYYKIDDVIAFLSQ